MDMIKVAVAAIVAVLLAVWLKDIKPAYSAYIALSAALLVCALTISRMSIVRDSIEAFRNLIPGAGVYLTMTAKMLGIAYLAEFTAGACRDCGYSALGSQIELLAKLSIVILSLPVLTLLLETINALMPS